MFPISEVWRDRLIRILNKLDLVWCPKCGTRLVAKARSK